MSEDTKETIKEAEIVNTEVTQIKNKPYSGIRKLTQKQINFIREKIKNPTISNAQAVINAGYDCKTRDYASRVGNKILSNALVQTELKKYIDNGEFDEKAKEVYKKILDKNFDNLAKESDKVNWASMQVKVIQEIHKVQGNYAPKRTENKSARVTFNIPKRNSN